jgi:hypothetical protein
VLVRARALFVLLTRRAELLYGVHDVSALWALPHM